MVYARIKRDLFSLLQNKTMQGCSENKVSCLIKQVSILLLAKVIPYLSHTLAGPEIGLCTFLFSPPLLYFKARFMFLMIVLRIWPCCSRPEVNWQILQDGGYRKAPCFYGQPEAKRRQLQCKMNFTFQQRLELQTEKEPLKMQSLERSHLVDWSYLMSVWFPFKTFYLNSSATKEKSGNQCPFGILINFSQFRHMNLCYIYASNIYRSLLQQKGTIVVSVGQMDR